RSSKPLSTLLGCSRPVRQRAHDACAARPLSLRAAGPPNHDREVGVPPGAKAATASPIGPRLKGRTIAARFGELMTEIVRAGAVGAYVPMVDGPEKVSGRAKYTADFIAPQMLTGRIYRSPYAHAEIIDVDTSQAAKVPGVVAIITGADC